VGADHAGLEADLRAGLFDAKTAETARRLDEDAVRDGLAREARSGGAEDQRNSMDSRDAEEAADLVRAFRVDDGLGNEPVEARVRRPRDPVDRAR